MLKRMNKVAEGDPICTGSRPASSFNVPRMVSAGFDDATGRVSVHSAIPRYLSRHNFQAAAYSRHEASAWQAQQIRDQSLDRIGETYKIGGADANLTRRIVVGYLPQLQIAMAITRSRCHSPIPLQMASSRVARSKDRAEPKLDGVRCFGIENKAMRAGQ
jgi:hypothetical protein